MILKTTRFLNTFENLFMQCVFTTFPRTLCDIQRPTTAQRDFSCVTPLKTKGPKQNNSRQSKQKIKSVSTNVQKELFLQCNMCQRQDFHIYSRTNPPSRVPTPKSDASTDLPLCSPPRPLVLVYPVLLPPRQPNMRYFITTPFFWFIICIHKNTQPKHKTRLPLWLSRAWTIASIWNHPTLSLWVRAAFYIATRHRYKRPMSPLFYCPPQPRGRRPHDLWHSACFYVYRLVKLSRIVCFKTIRIQFQGFISKFIPTGTSVFFPLTCV